MDVTRPAWVEEVLGFWFGEFTPEQWFKKDEAVDAIIRARFLALHAQLAAGPPASAATDPRTALAAAIVLDQFPRNMFRGSPRAFATDPQALALAIAAVDAGLDQKLTPSERTFLYVPFEHSEDKAVQARSVALFTALGNANYLDFAIRHKVIVDRFGRFPHRNAVLGRASTAEEIAFLKEPGSSF